MSICKIIAETGTAHGRSYSKCIAMMQAAVQAGADAIKFAAYLPEEMTIDSDEPPFIITNGQWDGLSLFDIYRLTALPYDWLPDLKQAAQSGGLDFILSVYHPNTVPLTDELGVRTVKVSSFELAYVELLEAIANSSVIKTVILSTGSASEAEIWQALSILSNKKVVLLYCVSSYPAQAKDLNLVTMQDMQKFSVPIGLSDHTTGLTAPVMSVSMGACIIEKHLKIDSENLDANFAVFPDQFSNMVQVVRQAEEMMGTVSYDRPKTYHRNNVDGKFVRVVW